MIAKDPSACLSDRFFCTITVNLLKTGPVFRPTAALATGLFHFLRVHASFPDKTVVRRTTLDIVTLIYATVVSAVQWPLVAECGLLRYWKGQNTTTHQPTTRPLASPASQKFLSDVTGASSNKRKWQLRQRSLVYALWFHCSWMFKR